MIISFERPANKGHNPYLGQHEIQDAEEKMRIHILPKPPHPCTEKKKEKKSRRYYPFSPCKNHREKNKNYQHQLKHERDCIARRNLYKARLHLWFHRQPPHNLFPVCSAVSHLQFANVKIVVLFFLIHSICSVA